LRVAQCAFPHQAIAGMAILCGIACVSGLADSLFLKAPGVDRRRVYCLTATVHASSCCIGYNRHDAVGIPIPRFLEASGVDRRTMYRLTATVCNPSYCIGYNQRDSVGYTYSSISGYAKSKRRFKLQCQSAKRLVSQVMQALDKRHINLT